MTYKFKDAKLGQAVEQHKQRRKRLRVDGTETPAKGSVAAKKFKYTLERVRLNSGGYTSAGQYYGQGAPLFEACSDETGDCLTFRAADRKAAKAKLDRALEDISSNPLALSREFNHYELKRFAGLDNPAGSYT